MQKFNEDELRRVAKILAITNPRVGSDVEGIMDMIRNRAAATFYDGKPGYVETVGYCVTAFHCDGETDLSYKVTLSSYGIELYLSR